MPKADFFLDTEQVRTVRNGFSAVASSGKVRLLVVGPDGSGKISAVYAALQHQSSLVLHGTPEPTRASYQPVAEALWPLIQKANTKKKIKDIAVELGADFISILPFLGAAGERIKKVFQKWGVTDNSPLGDRFLVAQHIGAVLDRLGGKYPSLVVIFEDIVLYDTDTLTLISTLLRSGDLSYSIVATYDPISITTLSEADQRTVRDFLRSLSHSHRFDSVPFSTLTEADTREFLHGYLGTRALAAGQVAQIHALTGGNLEFVKKYVEQLGREGLLVTDEAGTSIQQDVPLPQCAFVSEHVDGRLSNLTDQQRKIIDSAAVVGVRFDIPPIAELLKASHIDVGRELREIARRHMLVQEVDARTYAFAEAYLRDTIYHQIGPVLARAYHVSLVEFYKRSTDRNRDALIYEHLRAVDRLEEAMAYLGAAAEYAEAEKDVRLALRYRSEHAQLLRHLLAAREEFEQADQQMLRAAERAEEKGLFTDAIAAFTWLYEQAADLGLRSTALLRAGVCRWLAERPLDAHPILEQVLAEHADVIAPVELVEARLTMASIQYHMGRWEEARSHYKSCFRIDELKHDPVLLAKTRRNVNMFYFAETSLPLLHDSLKSLRTRKNLALYWEMRHNIGCVYLVLGQLENARITFQEAVAEFTKSGDYKRWLSENNLGIVYMLAGDYGPAEEHFRKVVETELSPFEIKSAQCHLALVDVLRGESAGLLALESLAETLDSSDENQLRELILHNLGWARMLAGYNTQAAESLVRALPAGFTPWSQFQTARTLRLLNELTRRGVAVPEEFDFETAGAALERSGRGDKWPYVAPRDFAFNEFWCWE